MGTYCSVGRVLGTEAELPLLMLRLAHSLSLASFSCTLCLSLVLNNFYKLLLTSNMSLLIKAYVHLPFCHVYVSTLFMESLQKVWYFL